MSYLKPQTPLQHKDGDYFYPLTTIDQVIMEDGITRLNGADLVSVNTDGAPEGETVKVNADTLGGYPATDYVKRYDVVFGDGDLSIELDNSIEGDINPVNADTLGGNSLDDVKTYVNNQITNRVIHSGGKNLLNINNPTKKNTIIDSNGSFEENNGFMTYRIPSTGGYMTISFTPQSRFDAIRYASEIDGVITRYSSLSGVTVDASQWDALWISIMPIDDFVTNVMVEAGSVATEHEPYYESLSKLTDRVEELLWENGSPTSSFSAKTISVDLTNWEKIIVFVYDTASDCSLVSEYGKKGYTSRISVARLYNPSGTKYLALTRKFTVSDDGINFTDSVISNGSAAINDNNTMIPVYIYGIKEVS